MDELRVWIRLPVLIFRFYFAPSCLCVNASEMVSRKVGRDLGRAYKLMRARFGHQHWWPGETPFEVCVGAILTQNTAWTNVERALANLKAACVLEPARLFALPESRLAGLIRPAGYFNVKARRLRSFLRVLVEDFGGDLKRLFDGELSTVRARLLAINGVGPETADSLLLYAGGHHSFVIDAYTRRIFQLHEWSPKPTRLRFTPARQAVQSPNSSAGYDDLKLLCESALNQKAGAARLDYWQDYHAQLVMVGKHFCRPRAPLCEQCPLKPLLPKNR
jgi:endonuclease-3 related protein